MSNNGHTGKREWISGALDRYEGQLTRYAQGITGDGEQARDVVQETFMRLCREQPSNIDGHLAKWLFTVCRNQALDVCRKESRMTALTDPQRISDQTASTTPAAAAEQQDESERILRLVENLPPRQREVIRLRFQSSLTYAEIAAVTGMSSGNVGLLIHRGLAALRNHSRSN